MRYANIIENDFSAGEGVCVSLFTQGCPHRCQGCHNPETWDYNGGKIADKNLLAEQICNAVNKNGIQRNFAILGGEPLIKQNRLDLLHIIWAVRHDYPSIKIYLWTGYIYENLLEENDDILKNIFANIDYLIDGPYIEKLRDITLPMRGSSNQRIIPMK